RLGVVVVHEHEALARPECVVRLEDHLVTAHGDVVADVQLGVGALIGHCRSSWGFGGIAVVGGAAGMRARWCMTPLMRDRARSSPCSRAHHAFAAIWLASWAMPCAPSRRSASTSRPARSRSAVEVEVDPASVNEASVG